MNVLLIILIKESINLLNTEGDQGLAMQDEEDYKVETDLSVIIDC